MEEIKVAKPELLLKLRQNRADHRAIFEEALNGYRQEAITLLETQLADLRNGKRRDVRVVMTVPHDHTNDYDRAIAMIEMSLGERITISEDDFAKYVMDDWGWQGQFLNNTYGSSTAVSKFSERYVVS